MGVGSSSSLLEQPWSVLMASVVRFGEEAGGKRAVVLLLRYYPPLRSNTRYL